VADVAAGWAGVTAGASTGVGSCPKATSGLNPIAKTKTEAIELRMFFSLIANTERRKADADRRCNRVGRVFAAV
jgi:hypothetical protein